MSVQLFLYDAAGFPGLFHIDDPLIAAAPEGQGEIPLFLLKGSVDQYIGCLQQCVYGWLLTALQLFERIACIDPDIQCPLVKLSGKSRQWLRLAERLAAAEGDSG